MKDKVGEQVATSLNDVTGPGGTIQTKDGGNGQSVTEPRRIGGQSLSGESQEGKSRIAVILVQFELVVEMFRRWEKVGIDNGMTRNSDIAILLLQHFEKASDQQQGIHCIRCHCRLQPSLCQTCSDLSKKRAFKRKQAFSTRISDVSDESSQSPGISKILSNIAKTIKRPNQELTVVNEDDVCESPVQDQTLRSINAADEDAYISSVPDQSLSSVSTVASDEDVSTSPGADQPLYCTSTTAGDDDVSTLPVLDQTQRFTTTTANDANIAASLTSDKSRSFSSAATREEDIHTSVISGQTRSFTLTTVEEDLIAASAISDQTQTLTWSITNNKNGASPCLKPVHSDITLSGSNYSHANLGPRYPVMRTILSTKHSGAKTAGKNKNIENKPEEETNASGQTDRECFDRLSTPSTAFDSTHADLRKVPGSFGTNIRNERSSLSSTSSCSDSNSSSSYRSSHESSPSHVKTNEENDEKTFSPAFWEEFSKFPNVSTEASSGFANQIAAIPPEVDILDYSLSEESMQSEVLETDTSMEAEHLQHSLPLKESGSDAAMETVSIMERNSRIHDVRSCSFHFSNNSITPREFPVEETSEICNDKGKQVDGDIAVSSERVKVHLDNDESTSGCTGLLTEHYTESEKNSNVKERLVETDASLISRRENPDLSITESTKDYMEIQSEQCTDFTGDNIPVSGKSPRERKSVGINITEISQLNSFSPDASTLTSPLKSVLPEVTALTSPLNSVLPELNCVLPAVSALTSPLNSVLPELNSVLPAVSTYTSPLNSVLSEEPALFSPLNSVPPELPALFSPVNSVSPELPALFSPLNSFSPAVPTHTSSLNSDLPEVFNLTRASQANEDNAKNKSMLLTDHDQNRATKSTIAPNENFEPLSSSLNAQNHLIERKIPSSPTAPSCRPNQTQHESLFRSHGSTLLSASTEVADLIDSGITVKLDTSVRSVIEQPSSDSAAKLDTSVRSVIEQPSSDSAAKLDTSVRSVSKQPSSNNAVKFVPSVRSVSEQPSSNSAAKLVPSVRSVSEQPSPNSAAKLVPSVRSVSEQPSPNSAAKFVPSVRSVSEQPSPNSAAKFVPSVRSVSEQSSPNSAAKLVPSVRSVSEQPSENSSFPSVVSVSEIRTLDPFAQSCAINSKIVSPSSNVSAVHAPEFISDSNYTPRVFSSDSNLQTVNKGSEVTLTLNPSFLDQEMVAMTSVTKIPMSWPAPSCLISKSVPSITPAPESSLTQVNTDSKVPPNTYSSSDKQKLEVSSALTSATNISSHSDFCGSNSRDSENSLDASLMPGKMSSGITPVSCSGPNSKVLPGKISSEITSNFGSSSLVLPSKMSSEVISLSSSGPSSLVSEIRSDSNSKLETIDSNMCSKSSQRQPGASIGPNEGRSGLRHASVNAPSLPSLRSTPAPQPVSSVNSAHPKSKQQTGLDLGITDKTQVLVKNKTDSETRHQKKALLKESGPQSSGNNDRRKQAKFMSNNTPESFIQVFQQFIKNRYHVAPKTVKKNNSKVQKNSSGKNSSVSKQTVHKPPHPKLLTTSQKTSQSFPNSKNAAPHTTSHSNRPSTSQKMSQSFPNSKNAAPHTTSHSNCPSTSQKTSQSFPNSKNAAPHTTSHSNRPSTSRKPSNSNPSSVSTTEFSPLGFDLLMIKSEAMEISERPFSPDNDHLEKSLNTPHHSAPEPTPGACPKYINPSAFDLDVQPSSVSSSVLDFDLLTLSVSPSAVDFDLEQFQYIEPLHHGNEASSTNVDPLHHDFSAKKLNSDNCLETSAMKAEPSTSKEVFYGDVLGKKSESNYKIDSASLSDKTSSRASPSTVSTTPDPVSRSRPFESSESAVVLHTIPSISPALNKTSSYVLSDRAATDTKPHSSPPVSIDCHKLLLAKSPVINDSEKTQTSIAFSSPDISSGKTDLPKPKIHQDKVLSEEGNTAVNFLTNVSHTPYSYKQASLSTTPPLAISPSDRPLLSSKPQLGTPEYFPLLLGDQKILRGHAISGSLQEAQGHQQLAQQKNPISSQTFPSSHQPQESGHLVQTEHNKTKVRGETVSMTSHQAPQSLKKERETGTMDLCNNILGSCSQILEQNKTSAVKEADKKNLVKELADTMPKQEQDSSVELLGSQSEIILSDESLIANLSSPGPGSDSFYKSLFSIDSDDLDVDFSPFFLGESPSPEKRIEGKNAAVDSPITDNASTACTSTLTSKLTRKDIKPKGSDVEGSRQVADVVDASTVDLNALMKTMSLAVDSDSAVSCNDTEESAANVTHCLMDLSSPPEASVPSVKSTESTKSESKADNVMEQNYDTNNAIPDTRVSSKVHTRSYSKRFKEQKMTASPAKPSVQPLQLENLGQVSESAPRKQKCSIEKAAKEANFREKEKSKKSKKPKLDTSADTEENIARCSSLIQHRIKFEKLQQVFHEQKVVSREDKTSKISSTRRSRSMTRIVEDTSTKTSSTETRKTATSTPKISRSTTSGIDTKSRSNPKISKNRSPVNRGSKARTAEVSNSLIVNTKTDTNLTLSRCKRASDLKQHLQTHTQDKTFKCKLCDKAYTTSNSLELHTRTHTGERPYLCNICARPFTYKSNLKAHLDWHKGEKKFQCSHCDKKTMTLSELRKHLKSHSGVRNHFCKECGVGFVQSSALKMHMVIHSGAQPFKCELCQKTFAHRTSLRSHRLTHEGVKPYKCQHCDQSYVWSSDLTKHMRTHTGEKPYKCKFCPKVFRVSNHLTVHERTHTGQKPFLCEHCGEAFAQTSNVIEHKRKKHPM